MARKTPQRLLKHGQVSHGNWVKPLSDKQTQPACGCVFSIMGYALFLCPKHDKKDSK